MGDGSAWLQARQRRLARAKRWLRAPLGELARLAAECRSGKVAAFSRLALALEVEAHCASDSPLKPSKVLASAGPAAIPALKVLVGDAEASSEARALAAIILGALKGSPDGAPDPDEDKRAEIQPVLDQYVRRFAKAAHLELANGGDVRRLLTGKWYDDGVVKWGSDATGAQEEPMDDNRSARRRDLQALLRTPPL